MNLAVPGARLLLLQFTRKQTAVLPARRKTVHASGPDGPTTNAEKRAAPAQAFACRKAQIILIHHF